MYHIPLAFQCIYECIENWDREEEKEWRLYGLLDVDDLVLCG